MPSAVHDYTWEDLIRPLSSCRRRRDTKKGTLPKVTMMEVVGVLIGKDMLKYAAKVINRRRISGINKGDGSGASEMTKRCGRGTYKTKSAGFNVHACTPVPRSCESRISPAAACRLARTERKTQEGSVNDPDRVYGRSGRCSAFRGTRRPSWFRCLHCSLLSKGCCARSRQRCAINPKNLSVDLAFSDDDHRKTSRDTPVAHRCTDSYVECTGADPGPPRFSDGKSSEKA